MRKAGYLLVILLTIAWGCSQETDLPDMVIKFNKGGEMNLKEVEANTVVVLYQPTCDHCQKQAEAVRQNISAFENYGVFFVTDQSFTLINEFSRIYKLGQTPNVFFAQTSYVDIIDQYGPVETPSIYIYKDGKLTKSWNGITPIKEIIAEL